MNDFVAQLRGSPGSPSERQMNQESLMKAILGDKNMQEKTTSWRVPGAEPCVFHVFFLVHISKTFFFACFSRKICSPSGNPLGRGETKSSQNDRKNTGFWKLADQNDRKNTGFCIGAEPKPRFFSRFRVARLTFI